MATSRNEAKRELTDVQQWYKNEKEKTAEYEKELNFMTKTFEEVVNSSPTQMGDEKGLVEGIDGAMLEDLATYDPKDWQKVNFRLVVSL
jgi:hypothetical protein